MINATAAITITITTMAIATYNSVLSVVGGGSDVADGVGVADTV